MDLNKEAILALSDREARAAWSGIAEPADHRIGALVQKIGTQESLLWAAEPFVSHGNPGEESGAWRLVHERVNLRYRQLDLSAELARIVRLGGQVMIPSDENWPKGLSDLELGMPYALWTIGNLPTPNQRAAAIVGARASTSYGNAVATDFAFELVESGCVVVSGGAYGIDSAAHRGALSAASKKRTDQLCPTVAVLCGGLGNPYPAGNTELFKGIVQNGGGLVSEMPPSFRPARWRFLERNRVIAALSDATIIVEASRRSGAIATANRAMDLGKDVGAVPGPITSASSMGSNQLLADGAAVVTSSREIMLLIGHVEPNATQDTLFSDSESNARGAPPGFMRADPLERRTWDALPKNGTATVTDTASASGISEREAHRSLIGLLALGLVTQNGDGTWARSS